MSKIMAQMVQVNLGAILHRQLIRYSTENDFSKEGVDRFDLWEYGFQLKNMDGCEAWVRF